MIRFYLPEIISTNKIYSGIHWTKRKKHKELYLQIPFTAKPITEYPVTCHYHFHIKNNYDLTNLSYMIKLIEDCLVYKGILENDSPKYVNGITIALTKSNENYCEIKIEKTDRS